MIDSQNANKGSENNSAKHCCYESDRSLFGVVEE